jgi:hypothetical protein
MAQDQNSKKPVSIEEFAYSNMMQHEALVRVLIKKNIVSKKEITQEYKQLLKEMEKKQTQKDLNKA